MNPYLRHLKFRFTHSALPSFVLLFFFLLSNVTPLPSSKNMLRDTTFESYFSMHRSYYFLLFFILVVIVNVFILYRNYNGGKERWLLLPQKKSLLVIIDILWMCLLILVLFLLQWIMYYFGFQAFLVALEKAEVLHHVQTRSFLTSLSIEPMMHQLFPGTFLGYLRNITMIGFFASLVSFSATQMMVERSSKWKILTLFVVIFMVLILMALKISVIWSCIIALFLCWYMFKMAINAWNNKSIGG